MIKFRKILAEIGINNPIYGPLGISNEKEFNDIVSNLCRFSIWLEFDREVPLISNDEYIMVNELVFPLNRYQDVKNQCILKVVGEENFKKNYKLCTDSLLDLQIGVEWCGLENGDETEKYPYNLYNIYYDETVYFPLKKAIYPIKSKKDLYFQILEYFRRY